MRQISKKKGDVFLGRRNKSLNRQLFERLESMSRIGESKHQAKQEYRQYCESHGIAWNPAKATGIFSYKTYDAYKQTSKEFARWLKENYGIKNIDQITRHHCSEYLRERQDEYKTSWTNSKDLSAMNKLFNFGLTKSEVGLNPRSYKNVVRSRLERPHDSKVNLKNYKDQVTFACGSGCRRESVLRVVPADFRRDNSGMVVAVRLVEKGGLEREATILQSYREEITRIVNNANADKSRPLFSKYPNRIDNHAFRSEYAAARYVELTVGKEDLKNDYRGYDAECLQKVSHDLGHNRISVVVEHYLRN